ncbi:hypothetical protein HY643_01230 [Candidatus Woesearchaeota archaeon]|nr:hypothetical protein [Candidatus Woesearchaeota archaeon]
MNLPKKICCSILATSVLATTPIAEQPNPYRELTNTFKEYENNFDKYKCRARNDFYSSLYILRICDFTFLFNRQKIEKDLTGKLNRIGHSRRADDAGQKYREGYDQLPKLGRIDLMKANMLVKQLGEKDFCNKIGIIIKDDLSDIYSEHGGVIRADSGSLEFKVVPSLVEDSITLLQKILPKSEPPKKIKDFVSEQFNGTYTFSGRLADVFSVFHLHAVHTTDYSRKGYPADAYYAGPSTPDLNHSKRIGIDGVVITNIGEKKFNIDFYTTEGVVIDLGNYTYD